MSNHTSTPSEPTSVLTEHGSCWRHGKYERIRFGQRNLGCPTCEAERLEEQRQARIDRSGLNGRFRTATFDAFNAATAAQKRVVDACRDFAAGPLDQWRVLWLQGPVGTGKSHLLAAMALGVISRERSARVATAREIVRRIRATWRNGAQETEDSVIGDLATCSLLAIDELGVGYGTDGELLHLLDVVDARYQRAKPTAIASNLNTEQLRAALGDRLLDRMAENATVRACTWASHRRGAPV